MLFSNPNRRPSVNVLHSLNLTTAKAVRRSSPSDMLTMKDLRLNILEISVYSELNLLPLQFHSNSATFVLVKSPWRRFLSRLQFALFVAQGGIANYRLLQSLIFPEYLIIRHFIFHLTLAWASGVAILWHWSYWFQWPNETARLYNYSFSIAIFGNNEKPRNRTWDASELPDTPINSLRTTESGQGFQRRTKLGWLTLFMPIIGALTLIFALAVYLTEPSLKILDFHGSASNIDTSWSGYLWTFLKSSYFVSNAVSSIVPVLTMQLLFLQTTMEKLDHILRL